MENMRALVSGQAGDCKCHWEGHISYQAKNISWSETTIVMYTRIYSIMVFMSANTAFGLICLALKYEDYKIK